MIVKAFVHLLRCHRKWAAWVKHPLAMHRISVCLAYVFVSHMESKNGNTLQHGLFFWLTSLFSVCTFRIFAAASSNSSWKLVCLLHNLNTFSICSVRLGSAMDASVTRIESDSDVGQSKFTFLLKCVDFQGHHHQIKPLNAPFLVCFPSVYHTHLSNDTEWKTLGLNKILTESRNEQTTKYTWNGQTFFIINKRDAQVSVGILRLG